MLYLNMIRLNRVLWVCFLTIGFGQTFGQYRSNEQALFSPTGDTVLVLWNQYLSTPKEGSLWTSNYHVYGKDKQSNALELLHEFKFSKKSGEFILDSIPQDSLRLFNLHDAGTPVFLWEEQGFEMQVNYLPGSALKQDAGFCRLNFSLSYCQDTIAQHQQLRTNECEEQEDWYEFKVWQHTDQQHFFVLFVYRENLTIHGEKKFKGHVIKRFVTMQP
jgi:hypothetical protein